MDNHFLIIEKVLNDKAKRIKYALNPYLSKYKIQLNSLLPKIVLIIGSVLIVLRLLFVPKYVVVQGTWIAYKESHRHLYPTPDINTALLHALCIAIITAVIFYFLKKR